jgi:hypothetical protein
MGAESQLRSRPGRTLHAAVWISLAALLLALGLLAFVALLVLINPGLSPGSEQLLTGPFRWASHPPGA